MDFLSHVDAKHHVRCYLQTKLKLNNFLPFLEGDCKGIKCANRLTRVLGATLWMNQSSIYEQISIRCLGVELTNKSLTLAATDRFSDFLINILPAEFQIR